MKKINKTNTTYTLSFTVVLTLFIVTFQMIWTMKLESDHQQTNIDEWSSKKSLYQVMDNFIDPDLFFRFRESPENIDKIAKFYNALTRAETFSFLSTFTQPIYVKNYSGPTDFLYSEQTTTLDGASYSGLKALQLNDAAYDYYNLTTISGDVIDFSGLNYTDGTIPILVGSQYQDTVALGQVLEVDYYSKPYRFVVTGILEPNTYIYYKGNPEYYLDQMLVVPYPKVCYEVNPNDFFFEGILYFAMINGDLSTPYTKTELFQALSDISVETDFSDFSVIGLPDFNIAYDALFSILIENQNTLIFMLIMTSMLIAFMHYEFGKMIVYNNITTYSLYYIEGQNNYKSIFLRTLLKPYFLSFGLSILLSYHLFRILPLSGIAISTIILILLFIPAYIMLLSNLKAHINHFI